MTTPTHLLASDLDGTIIPLEWNDLRRAEVEELALAMGARDDLAVAYVTGRHLSLALEGIRYYGLPRPDALVCDVGTSVYYPDGADSFTEDQVYAERMQEAFGAMTGANLRKVLETVEGLTLQEEEKQGAFKVSFYFPVGVARERLVATVGERLGRVGARVKMVDSLEAGGGRGLLDLLPRGISKGYAVRYLQERYGLPREGVLYAGDSGNDMDALLSGFNAVVVGNAPGALTELLRVAAQRAGLQDHLYFAKGWYAGGVLEGGRHFRVL